MPNFPGFTGITSQRSVVLLPDPSEPTAHVLASAVSPPFGATSTIHTGRERDCRPTCWFVCAKACACVPLPFAVIVTETFGITFVPALRTWTVSTARLASRWEDG